MLLLQWLTGGSVFRLRRIVAVSSRAASSSADSLSFPTRLKALPPLEIQKGESRSIWSGEGFRECSSTSEAAEMAMGLRGGGG